MADGKRLFMVDGKPFFVLGRHRIYMGGYSVHNEAEIEVNFKAAKETHGNTVGMAIFWDQIEPEEGKFDFTSIDTLIKIARQYELKLIFLWFAAWKNAVMDYAPVWIKSNPKHFKMVISPIGSSIWTLSSHCRANLDADKKAFAALCKHLKDKDTDHTVIAIQIENEPGIIGSDRDYGPEAQAVFDSRVPAALMSKMKKAGKGDIFDLWQKAGGKASGTWPQIFGTDASELMTAWSIASFINEVAKAGKAYRDIPMFVNVSLGEREWWPIPGEAYPSGGAVAKVLDIYRWFAPYVDMIAPDNFHENPKQQELVNGKFARKDNPLLIVECPDNLNRMVHDIAEYDAVGYLVHYDQNEDGTIPPKENWKLQLTQSIAAAIPLLLKYQNTGKIYSVEQEDGMKYQRLDLDGYTGLISFKEIPDSRTAPSKWPFERAAGLVIQASRQELYLTGVNFRLMLRPKATLEKRQATLLIRDFSHPAYINHVMSVDEGHFDKNDEFVPDRRINGDDLRGGVWVEPAGSVIRIITCD
jgi:hypothetical protein